MADRGIYGSTDASKPGGWKTIVIVAGVAVGIYLFSPGGRHFLKHGKLPPHPEEDFERLARSKGFTSGRAYEEAVIATAREQQAAKFRPTTQMGRSPSARGVYERNP